MKFRIYHEIFSKKVGPVCSSNCNNATTHSDAKGWVTRQSSKSSRSTFISSLNQLILIHEFTSSFLHNSIFISSYFSQFIFTSVCHLIFSKIFFRFRGLVKWVDWLESDSSLVYWNDWRHQLPNQLLDMSQYSDINQIAYGEIHYLEKDEMLNITSCRYALPHII